MPRDAGAGRAKEPFPSSTKICGDNAGTPMSAGYQPAAPYLQHKLTRLYMAAMSGGRRSFCQREADAQC